MDVNNNSGLVSLISDGIGVNMAVNDDGQSRLDKTSNARETKVDISDTTTSPTLRVVLETERDSCANFDDHDGSARQVNKSNYPEDLDPVSSKHAGFPELNSQLEPQIPSGQTCTIQSDKVEVSDTDTDTDTDTGGRDNGIDPNDSNQWTETNKRLVYDVIMNSSSSIQEGLGDSEESMLTESDSSSIDRDKNNTASPNPFTALNNSLEERGDFEETIDSGIPEFNSLSTDASSNGDNSMYLDASGSHSAINAAADNVDDDQRMLLMRSGAVLTREIDTTAKNIRECCLQLDVDKNITITRERSAQENNNNTNDGDNIPESSLKTDAPEMVTSLSGFPPSINREERFDINNSFHTNSGFPLTVKDTNSLDKPGIHRRRRHSFHGHFMENLQLPVDGKALRRVQSEKHLRADIHPRVSTILPIPVKTKTGHVRFLIEESHPNQPSTEGINESSPLLENKPRDEPMEIAVHPHEQVPEEPKASRASEYYNDIEERGLNDQQALLEDQDKDEQHNNHENHDDGQHQHKRHNRPSCSNIGDCLFRLGSWRRKKRKSDDSHSDAWVSDQQEERKLIDDDEDPKCSDLTDISSEDPNLQDGVSSQPLQQVTPSDEEGKGSNSTDCLEPSRDSCAERLQTETGFPSKTEEASESSTAMDSYQRDANSSASTIISDKKTPKASPETNSQSGNFRFRRAFSQKVRQKPQMEGFSDDPEDEDQLTGLNFQPPGFGRHRRAISLKRHFRGPSHHHHHHHHHPHQHNHLPRDEKQSQHHHHHHSFKDHLLSFLEHLHSSEPPSPLLRTGSLNKHSLASVELSSWASRGSSRRGVNLAPFGSTLSPTEVSSRTEILQAISSAIIHLFQRKPLKENELGCLQEHVRFLINAEAGALVSEYYKDQLLRKGMVILREKIKNEQGLDLLRMLSETWEYFFREILPSLQAVLYPLASILRNDESIRSLSLLAFRNIVVLKVSLKEALDSVEKKMYPAGIKQMLLVLQGMQDNVFLSENQFLLEKLVARVVSPYMGQRGVYEGSPEPVIKFKLKPSPFNIPHNHESEGERMSVKPHHFQAPTSKSSLTPPSHGPDKAVNSQNCAKDIKKLNPVLERVAEGSRRHSVIS